MVVSARLQPDDLSMELPLPPDIAAEISATIEQIRAMATDLVNAKNGCEGYSEESRVVVMGLVETAERLMAVLPEVLASKTGLDVESVNNIIRRLRLYFHNVSRILLEIDSIRHPENGRRMLYFLRLKRGSDLLDNVSDEPIGLSDSFELISGESDRARLLAKMMDYRETLPRRAIVYKTLLTCFIAACEQGKSFSPEYAFQVHRQMVPSSPVTLTDLKNSLYRLKAKVGDCAEECGFAIAHSTELGIWQAVPVSGEVGVVETGADVAEGEERAEVSATLKERVLDAVRHIVSSLTTLKKQEVEYLCGYISDVSEGGKWTYSKEIEEQNRAKELGITSEKVMSFKRILRRILSDEEGRKVLGFEIEKRGVELFRFRLIEPYEKAELDYTGRSAVVPISVPEICFDETYFESTFGTWVLGYSGKDSYMPVVIRAISAESMAKKAVTVGYIAAKLGLSKVQVLNSIDHFRRTAKANGWEMEMIMIAKSNAYYLSMMEAGKQDDGEDAFNSERHLVEKILFEHRTGEGAMGFDMDEIARAVDAKKQAGEDLDISTMIVEQANQVHAIAIKEGYENMSLEQISALLVEIILDRVETSERILDSQRHFKILTPEVRFIFESLGKKALRGEAYTTSGFVKEVNEQAPNITRQHYDKIIDTVDQINADDPRVLGYERVRLGNNMQIVKSQKGYLRAEVPYDKESAAYLVPIEDEGFQFDRSLYEVGVAMLLEKSHNRKNSLRMDVFAEFAGYSEAGMGISQRLFAKRMNVREDVMRRIVFDLKKAVASVPELPIAIKEGSKKTFYIETLSKSLPVAKSEPKPKPKLASNTGSEPMTVADKVRLLVKRRAEEAEARRVVEAEERGKAALGSLSLSFEEQVDALSDPSAQLGLLLRNKGKIALRVAKSSKKCAGLAGDIVYVIPRKYDGVYRFLTGNHELKCPSNCVFAYTNRNSLTILPISELVETE